MIRRPPRSTQSRSSAASDVYKRQTTYNVERLGVVLAANDLQIGRGQQTAYIPFALCRTRTHAQETIDRMKRKQATLAALNEPRDESGEDLGVTICMEADVAGEGVPV